MKSRLTLLFPLLLLIAACSTSKKTQTVPTINLDGIKIRAVKEYQASATRVNDLLHTELHVKFDFEKQHLIGTALLTFKPYVKPVSTLELDAKGFDILKVGKISGNDFTPLTYKYDSLKLVIDLQKTYTEKDTYKVQIDYIAKPNDLPQGGSAAITSDKGLYFINPVGKEKNKPMQIWTQGETEANSCWFPTIDKPNEKATDEIFITVPDTLVTLSNGLLIKSTKNGDGTKTDDWKMDMPHSTYLVMMAIGDYAVVHDIWHGKPVDYYVEKSYEPYARNIFGNTPEMMEFYSKILGYDYPWQKYAQVVARDYVSGAMENTTATLHFEILQMTKRELIDKNYEDIICHELFHHWFGDLLTCESWSNLTLNEGFATYAEYLWAEHKYGKDEAERQRDDMLDQYYSEAFMYKRPIIDFHFEDREDMFDSHSYAKGGLVLHMLRNYLGDEIFFRGLNLYLKEHAYQNVEIHDLRLAMEQVSGEDLNWFFNQWYLSPGHPQLDVSYYYNDATKLVSITLQQTQDSASPVFRLPLAIDIYSGSDVKRENVVMEKRKQIFDFPVSDKPQLVNVDGDKYLLCAISDYKSVEEYAFEYDKAPGYLNKKEAITHLALHQEDSLAQAKLIAALKDKFWDLRKLAVEKINLTEKTKPLLAKVARLDEKSNVRAAAIKRLSETADDEYMEIYKKGLTDSSLLVISDALDAISTLDDSAALAVAPQFEEFNTHSIISAIGQIYVSSGGDDKQAYFERKAYEASGYSRYSLISSYGDYLKKKNETMVRQGTRTLDDIALNAGSSWERYAATNAIHEIKDDLNSQLENKQKDRVVDEAKVSALIGDLQTMLDKIIATEKDPSLLKRYGNFN